LLVSHMLSPCHLSPLSFSSLPSLHDALPISLIFALPVTIIAYLVMASFSKVLRMERAEREGRIRKRRTAAAHGGRAPEKTWRQRSEEHTSELQSRFDLVCRLLLEIQKLHIHR